MNTKEKTYMMALAALLLIGLSTAWAGYTATETITASSIQDFPTVSNSGSSITLSNLKKYVWFYKSRTKVFTISNIKVDYINVTVSVVNMGDIADNFYALDILVTLNDTADVLDYGVISLEGGTSSVILGVPSSVRDKTLYVNVAISGMPAKTEGVTIYVYCAVEPAEAVSA